MDDSLTLDFLIFSHSHYYTCPLFKNIQTFLQYVYFDLGPAGLRFYSGIGRWPAAWGTGGTRYIQTTDKLIRTTEGDGREAVRVKSVVQWRRKGANRFSGEIRALVLELFYSNRALGGYFLPLFSAHRPSAGETRDHSHGGAMDSPSRTRARTQGIQVSRSILTSI